MGTTATKVYKRIAAMITEKHSKPYSRTMHSIRCRLSFSLLRSAIMCLRGSPSVIHRPAGMLTIDTMDLDCSEDKVYQTSSKVLNTGKCEHPCNTFYQSVYIFILQNTGKKNYTPSGKKSNYSNVEKSHKSARLSPML